MYQNCLLPRSEHHRLDRVTERLDHNYVTDNLQRYRTNALTTDGRIPLGNFAMQGNFRLPEPCCPEIALRLRVLIELAHFLQHVSLSCMPALLLLARAAVPHAATDLEP